VLLHFFFFQVHFDFRGCFVLSGLEQQQHVYGNIILSFSWFQHPQPLVTSHNRPQQLEVEMMTAVFDYIDRIFSMVRPRRLLYMAIDGVAPRAKMNQHRSHRFRASNDYWEKKVGVSKIREELLKKGRAQDYGLHQEAESQSSS
jgi:5'-3' exonuclease